MQLIIENGKNAVQELLELSEILYELRNSTLTWDSRGGFDNRKNKKFWEEKADAWIDQHLKNDI